jgi:hypothetical protein
MDTTIIIPYRNREPQLKIFIDNVWPKIKIKYSTCKLLIVNQSSEGLFNRGKLLNIGSILIDTPYLIFHDLDIHPTDKALDTLYNIIPINDNTIIGLYNTPSKTLGGIIKMSVKCFKSINGFINTYEGWGVEDKNLANRALYFKKNIEFKYIQQSKTEKSEYYNRYDNTNDRRLAQDFHTRTNFEYNEFNKLDTHTKEKHILSDGINTLNFFIIENINLLNDIRKVTVKL